MPGKAKISFEADTQKAISALNRQITKIEEQNQKLREGNRATKDMDQSSSRLGSSMKKVAENAAGIAAGLALARQAFTQFDAAAKQSADQLLLQQDQRKRLAQIGADPQTANRIALRTGLTLPKAQNLLFSAKSAGFTEQEIEALSVLQDVVPDVGVIFPTIEKLQTRFGKEKTGGSRRLLNKVLQASQESPLGFEQIAPESVKAAAAFQAIGGGDVDLLAASALAAKAEEPAVAITQIRAFASELSKRDDFPKEGLLPLVRQLRDEFTSGGVLDERGVAGSFVNVRAQAGGTLLVKNLETLERFVTNIAAAAELTGTAASPLNVALRQASQDRVLGGLQQVQRAAAAEEIGSEEFALREQAQQAILKRARGALRSRIGGREGPGVAFFYAETEAKLIALDLLHGLVGTAGGAARAVSARSMFGFDRAPELEEKLLVDFQDIIQQFRKGVQEFRPSGGAKIKANAAIE